MGAPLKRIDSELGPDQLLLRLPRRGAAALAGRVHIDVPAGQSAVLVCGSERVAALPAGIHDLDPAQLGLLPGQRIEVVFVSLRPWPQLKWGSLDPVLLRDDEFGFARLRALGMYSLEVVDAGRFVSVLLSSVTDLGTDAALGFLRSLTTAELGDSLARHVAGVSALPEAYADVCSSTEHAVRTSFARCGITLIDFRVLSISPPPRLQSRLRARS